MSLLKVTRQRVSHKTSHYPIKIFIVYTCGYFSMKCDSWILVTLQNNSQSYNWILLAHVVIKTARIKGSRASLNAIAVAVSLLRDSADVPFWLPGACDCCHKFETRFFFKHSEWDFFSEAHCIEMFNLKHQFLKLWTLQSFKQIYSRQWKIDFFDRNYLFWVFSCVYFFWNKISFWPDSKFLYSEKATKCCEIFTLLFDWHYIEQK